MTLSDLGLQPTEEAMDPSRRGVAPALLAATALAALAPLLPTGPVRAIGVFAFAALVPGLAVLHLLALDDDLLTWLVGGLAVSVSLVLISATGVLLAGAWSGYLAYYIVVGVTVVVCLGAIVRRRGQQAAASP